MESEETPSSLETEKIPTYDAIIVFGRGIAKDPKGKWRPTAYFEETPHKQHSGIFETDVDPQKSESAVVGGANANVLAAFHLYKELLEKGNPPSLVIFAAGRPPYLFNEAKDLSEGRVLEEKFRRKIGNLEGGKPETVVLTENRDTKDDLVESFKLILDRRLRNVAIITVGVHIPRSKELFDMFKQEGKLAEGLNVDFLASEDVLKRVSEKYRKRFKSLRQTAAYRRTATSERRKIKNLRSGGYQFTEKTIE